MRFCKTTRLFFLLFLWFNIAFSQNFPSKNYNAASELPNNTVRALLLDSDNVLWIGTDNGVVKKENDVFKYFFEEDGLALNSCWAIAEDRNKNLWFGSYGEGISIYNGAKFRVISEKDGLAHNEVTKLFSHKDHMFIGTSDGVSLVNINNYDVHTFNIPESEKLFRVQNFFEVKEQIYVVTYRSGIYKISGKDNEKVLTKVNNDDYVYSVLKNNDSIYISKKGFFRKTTLTDYLKKGDTISSKKLGYSIIWDYIKTRDQKIFAAGWGIYDTSGGIYEVQNDELISRASDFNIFSKEVISLAYDDKFEKLYVGTRDAGLFEIKLDPLVKFHRTEGKNIIGFARTGNTSAELSSNGILIKEKEIKINLDQLKKWQEEYIKTTKQPLPKHEDSFYELDYSTRARDIQFYDIKTYKDVYWVNTNIGIFAIEENGKLHRYLPLHSEEINFTINGDLIETHPYGGVRVYQDLNKFEYTHFLQDHPETPTLVVNSLQTNRKTYFLSVFSGLYAWEKDEFSSYIQSGRWKEKKLRHITSLGKNLAISNEFGDVFIVNDGKSFEILKKIPRAKIEGNTISFLKEYQGSLLIGTEKGLSLYKDDRFIYLNEEQGLKQPFLSGEVDGNRLVIGSKDGYYTIDLNRVSDAEPLVNDLNIKEIFINNNEFAYEEFTGETEIDLPYDQNTVLLKFSTNAHPYPHKLRYQYRLNNSENWSRPFPEPQIFLPFLPSKDYEVDVRVLDKSTGLSYTQSLLNMAILPPFYKSWWFLLIVMSTISLLIFSIYKFQIRQTRNFEMQKRLIQKRFEETKMEALLAQMNPHFIFNAMNSIQNYIMDSDIDNATIFLGDFAKLIRLNLDHCTKPSILLVEEIEYLRSYIRIENTRFNNKIEVVMSIDPEIDTYEVEIPTMILQTFVENVFVHAFPGDIKDPRLEISFKLLTEDLLQCKIQDNGIGFTSGTTNKLHDSKGVRLVQERLALLGYNVEEAVRINSKKNKGTTVIITLEI
ncbi:histidine kinase [Gramella sp. MT6]|uniref:sensor histidine kinase n=1 Tax=Gramella sp. MT6 TaxID=2705471 RepID=UPI001C5EF674|nr:histidine kinase [Gramella sp. MT6]QYA27083.1 histidine kinase [Gramella sp. MT6]